MEREALEAEQQFLAIAMAESLDEDNARKAAERPLEEWDDKCLLERFKASQILREVHAAIQKTAGPVSALGTAKTEPEQ